MMVRRWNPWHERGIDRYFDYNPSRRRPLLGEEDVGFQKMPFEDVSETDSEIKLDVELPGVKKEEINLNAEGDGISISVKSGDNQRFKEFYRFISLPDNADLESIQASCDNGVLRISIPKKKAKGRNINID
jgi:HSP20 family protein